MIRFVFMGTPEYAKIILESLHAHELLECIALFTQPDRPVGRKQILTPPIITSVAKEHNIPLFQPYKLGEEERLQIQNLQPDFIIVAAFGQLLPESILSIAPCINLHTSLLPQYRGASPLQESLLNNDEYVGVTAIWMDKGLDTGDILGYAYEKRCEEAKFECLLKRLGFIAANLTKDILLHFPFIERQKQHNLLTSYVKKRSKKESLTDFSNAQLTWQKFKAFYPWPGIHLEDGTKIKDMSLCEQEGEQGIILNITSEGVIVGCGIKSILLKEIQPPNKNVMKAIDYLRGKRLTIGDLWS